MNPVSFPEGLRLERLGREHPRRAFDCGEEQVNDWLQTKALQHQEKHLSVTRVLLDPSGAIVGFYTLAPAQVSFAELPEQLTRHLPRRLLPVAVLAWLGVAQAHQGRGIGGRLLAQALRDCWEAGKTFAFIAILLDCPNPAVKDFYRQWDFIKVPGYPNRMYLSAKALEAVMEPRA